MEVKERKSLQLAMKWIDDDISKRNGKIKFSKAVYQALDDVTDDVSAVSLFGRAKSEMEESEWGDSQEIVDELADDLSEMGWDIGTTIKKTSWHRTGSDY